MIADAAFVSPSYVAACVAVPLVWGAAVHWLFAAWHARQEARHPLPQPETMLEAEAEEPNVP
jgi:hypothetical protein